jgi:uncharacterized membrane protein YgaE (UPF0421/DUF939 family)
MEIGFYKGIFEKWKWCYLIIFAALAIRTNGQNSINSISFVISIALIMG